MVLDHAALLESATGYTTQLCRHALDLSGPLHCSSVALNFQQILMANILHRDFYFMYLLPMQECNGVFGTQF